MASFLSLILTFLPSIYIAEGIPSTALPSTTTTAAPTPSLVGICPDIEWEYRNGFCYWSSSYNHGTQRMNSWFGAERECRRKGGDLVSIHSESENGFIHKMTHCARTWTGLSVVDESKRTKAEGMEWIDGTSRTYLNWYPGHPAGDGYSRHNCYYQHDSTGGKWAHAMCTTARYYYVCKKAAQMVPKDVRSKRADDSCGKGWKLAGRKCLHVNNTRVDFFEALLQCQSLGAHLATMHSAQEEAKLSRAFDSCDTPWIGLENTDPNRVNSNAGWKWNDNSVIGYSNWQNNIPTNDKTKQCGRIATGLSWINTHCWELHPFICQKSAV